MGIKTPDQHQIEAQAIMDFVNSIAGAHETGFVDRNHFTIAELYRVAQNHCLDILKVEVPNIEDKWGEDAAKALGFGDPNFK